MITLFPKTSSEKTPIRPLNFKTHFSIFYFKYRWFFTQHERDARASGERWFFTQHERNARASGGSGVQLE